MKNFFQKNGIMMLAAVTVVAVLLCVASALSSQTGFLQNAGGVIASPFRAVGSAVSGWFSSISQRFEDVEALQQENADLKKENAELQRQLDQAKIDSEENQRLRNLLNLRQQRRDFTFESAVIVDRSTSNWSRVMTLNKGTSSGIAVGNCVVDDQGNLVGVIREAGLNWSTITTILDTDSSLGARVFRTGEVTVAFFMPLRYFSMSLFLVAMLALAQARQVLRSDLSSADCLPSVVGRTGHSLGCSA